MDRPNQVYAGDITYIHTREGWLYLAVVIDLYSRQVVGWSMAEHMRAKLANDALLMAIWKRKPDKAYQCLSVFAGNPLVISPERLVADELLERADADDAPCFPTDRVDYEAVTEFKMTLLKLSFETFERRATWHKHKAFEGFCQQNAWLDTYSLFMALKEVHGFAAWNTWEEDIRTRHPKSMEHWRKKLDREIRCHKYQQYLFFEQWSELRKYCNDREIRFIGDVPMFVALDSVEVWSHPEMFYLDDRGKPIAVAGVPPDYFSRTGAGGS